MKAKLLAIAAESQTDSISRPEGQLWIGAPQPKDDMVLQKLLWHRRSQSENNGVITSIPGQLNSTGPMT